MHASVCVMLVASSSNNSIQSGELSEPDPEFEDLLEDHAPSVQLPSLVAPPVDDPIAAASDIPADVPSPKRRTLLQKATEDCAKPYALGTIIPNALIGEVLNCGIRHGATQRMQTDLFEILRRYVSPVIPSFSIAQRMAENRSYVSINDFPVCPKECSIYKKRFADITQAEMASICCPICGDLYIQHIKMIQYKPIKVSTYRHAYICKLSYICMHIVHLYAICTHVFLCLFCFCVLFPQ